MQKADYFPLKLTDADYADDVMLLLNTTTQA